jgi:diguanylate cyclase (GGDEF)-like protein/PAS domain S-box-containing protein
MTSRSKHTEIVLAETVKTRELALKALRSGDFDFALRAVERGEASIPEMVEDLKIYQSELEIQNDELRNAQVISERAVQRFNMLFTALPLPAFVIDDFGVVIDCNEEAEICFELDRKFLRSHFFPSLVCKEEQARLRRAIEHAKVDGEKSLLEVGMQTTGKSAKLIADIHLSLLPDPELSATNFAVIVVDQTERVHQRDQLLIDSEVFRISLEGVMILDKHGKIISVNAAFTKITGYTKEEAIGETPRMLKSGRHNDDFYKEMWEQLNQHKSWKGEIWNRKKGGDIFPQWLSISVSTDAQGKIKEYVGIFMDISEQKKSQDRIENLAFFDSLTGLANRRLLADRAHQAISFAKRQHCLIGVIYLDLDHFKEINDVMGHHIGDELLVQVADRLKACVRDVDTVSRMGGDEFVLLINELSNPDDAVEVIQKVLAKLSYDFQIDHHTFKVSCSLGASFYPLDGDNFDQLLQRADTAMYQAKSGGRNTFRLFTSEMNIRVQRHMMMRNDIQHGLENGQFYVVYQPQYDLNTLSLISVEALIRWQHPERGLISPGEFIPVAEESAIIIELGIFVMSQACKQAKIWLDKGYRLPVAVNVSYAQFVRNNLLGQIKDVLAETQLPPELLELELTESIMVADPENVLAVVDKLRAIGVNLAIDDFGTGYSSLSYLKRFAVHKLKIDQSFVRDILNDKDDASIVATIINFAKSLQMISIAEGVESIEQANLLREMGCVQIQGFWLSKPLTVAKMDDLLELSKS